MKDDNKIEKYNVLYDEYNVLIDYGTYKNFRLAQAIRSAYVLKYNKEFITMEKYLQELRNKKIEFKFYDLNVDKTISNLQWGD